RAGPQDAEDLRVVVGPARPAAARRSPAPAAEAGDRRGVPVGAPDGGARPADDPQDARAAAGGLPWGGYLWAARVESGQAGPQAGGRPQAGGATVGSVDGV